MFYGQFDLDRILFERYFSTLKNGFFVECGAFDGLTESTCKFFEESMEWTGLNIEPVPYAFDKLIVNRPLSINENYALSNLNKTKLFTNAIHPELGQHFGNGSLRHSNLHQQELVNLGCIFETFEVRCISFHELYLKHKIKKIDLFVLDVEGYEIPALQGILNVPYEVLPYIFCIESSISSLDKIKNLLVDYDFDISVAHNSFFRKRSRI
jgi:FkbM family methyltransferase